MFTILLFYLYIDIVVSGQNYCLTISKPENPDECNTHNDKESYCCKLSSVKNSTKETFCKYYKIDEYNGARTINYENEMFFINCGIGTRMGSLKHEGGADQVCGDVNPSEQKECSRSSTEYNSCCYFKTGLASGCFWLGTKYTGKTQYNKIVLECFSKSIWLNIYFLGLIFLIII